MKLVHHVFSDGTGWQQRRSQPQPKITVTTRVCAHDYIHFGTKLSSNPRESVITAIADTGCQSCLIGLKLILRLGLKRIDLLPVQHEMNAVNNNAIKIIGAALLRLSGRDKSGYPMETAQVCYVTPDTTNMYLSREACEDLGLVSPSFPTVGEAKGGNIQMQPQPHPTQMWHWRWTMMPKNAHALPAPCHPPFQLSLHFQQQKTTWQSFTNGFWTITHPAPSTRAPTPDSHSWLDLHLHLGWTQRRNQLPYTLLYQSLYIGRRK